VWTGRVKVRKSKKLAELTAKLELEPSVDDEDLTLVEATSVPVPLCLVMPLNQLVSSHTPTSPTSITNTPPTTTANANTQSGVPAPADHTPDIGANTPAVSGDAMMPQRAASGEEALQLAASSSPADSNTAECNSTVMPSCTTT